MNKDLRENLNVIRTFQVLVSDKFDNLITEPIQHSFTMEGKHICCSATVSQLGAPGAVATCM